MPGQRQRRLGQRAGDAEVGDLHPALAGHQDVAGLDVAVDEAPVVRGGERAGRLGDEPRRGARRQGAAPPDDRREVLALDELHDDERPDRVRAVVVDRDDADGWFSDAADCASCRKRSMKSGSAPYSGRRTLTATSRSSWASRAR